MLAIFYWIVVAIIVFGGGGYGLTPSGGRAWVGGAVLVGIALILIGIKLFWIPG